MPAKYPVAMPFEDIRDVAVVSALEYSVLASPNAGVPDDNRPAFSESSLSSDNAVGSGTFARAAAALATSSEFRARAGR